LCVFLRDHDKYITCESYTAALAILFPQLFSRFVLCDVVFQSLTIEASHGVQGWRRVAGELSKIVAFLESTSGSMVVAEGSLEGKE
jgi:hypothetical protein